MNSESRPGCAGLACILRSGTQIPTHWSLDGILQRKDPEPSPQSACRFPTLRCVPCAGADGGLADHIAALPCGSVVGATMLRARAAWARARAAARSLAACGERVFVVQPLCVRPSL
eukprot:gene14293-biopygen11311